MSLSSSGLHIHSSRYVNNIDSRAAVFLYENDEDAVVPSFDAKRLEVNSETAFEFENDLFVGRVVILHRPPADSVYPCNNREFFATRKRRWELRWQGQFKTPPVSGIEFGVEILQAHSPRLNFASRAFFSVLVKFARSLARNRGSDVYTNHSDEDCVTKYFRFPIHNCDMILSTPLGSAPPEIVLPTPLLPYGEHVQCNDMFKTNDHISISPIYTFVFYSMYLDFCSWDVHNVPFGLNGMSINRIVGNQPFSVVMRMGRNDELGKPCFRLVVANRNTSPAWSAFLAPPDDTYYSIGGGSFSALPSPRRTWTLWSVTKRLLGIPSRYVGACLRAPVSFVMRPGRAPRGSTIVRRHIPPLPDTGTLPETAFYSTSSI